MQINSDIAQRRPEKGVPIFTSESFAWPGKHFFSVIGAMFVEIFKMLR